MPTLHFVTQGTTPYCLKRDRDDKCLEWWHKKNVAVLGTFLPLTLADLRQFVRQYPVAWVEA